MAVLTTGQITVPTQIIDPWLGKIKFGSTIATLSDATPMKFGPGASTSFDIGEAEYVAEGANKGPSTIVPTTVPIKPHKFHKTVRTTEEVQWADEDHQLEVLKQILEQIQPALSRALDYGVFHGINPATGLVVPAMDSRLVDTTNVVAFDPAGRAYAAIDESDALVLGDGYVPRDAALDPAYASAFATLRNATTEQKLYPNLTYATAPAGELDGHRTSVSKTVGAVSVADTPTDVLGFVGDFSGIQWGVQKQIGLELIKYGDPDGQGDLKRNNQIAFRAEIVYGWGIAELDAFAKIVNDAS